MADTWDFYIPPTPDTGASFDFTQYQPFGGAAVELPGAPAQPTDYFQAPITTSTATYTPTFDFAPMPFGGEPTALPTQYTGTPSDFFAQPYSFAQAPTPDLSSLYQQAQQPLPDVVRQIAGMQVPTGGYGAGAGGAGGVGAAPRGAPSGAPAAGGVAAPAKSPDLISSLLSGLGGLKGLMSLGGGLAGLAASQKAQQQAEDIGSQIKTAYQTAAQQKRELAAPYITAGAAPFAMAQQGALGPAQLQRFQAQQARLAQAAERSGGVGAIQTAQAEQQMYQAALQDQQANALQLLGVANPILSSAIEADLAGTTEGLTTTLKYSQMANEAAARLFQSLGQMGAYTPQSATNPGVA